MSTSSPKPSLLNPDLSGLWSCARLGHDKKWWSKMVGTVIVATFVYSWIGGFLVPFLILFLFQIKCYNIALLLSLLVLIPYIIPIPPQMWIVRIYMQYGAHYFDGGCTTIMENPAPFRGNQPPVFAGTHPHGILCIGYFLVCGIRFRAIQDITNNKQECIKYGGVLTQRDNCKDRLPCTGLVVGYLAKAPLFNFFITKLTGSVSSASSENMKAFMKRKVSFGMLPGGFNEATLFKKSENIIYIKERKGFIKYCLRYGYEIWPLYIFGECETYNNLFHSSTNNQWIVSLEHWLNSHKFPTVFPVGPYWYSPFLPFSNIGIHAIISQNTRYQHVENPTQQQIDECHAWYVNEVNALFERHKWRFGYSEDTHLQIL